MATKVIFTPEFEREIKHLKRKYPAVTGEVRKIVVQLENDERPGDKIPGVGYEVYKVRLSNPSASRGKSGGFRLIYYVKISDEVFLISIYSKTEQINVSAENIQEIIQSLGEDTDGEE